MGQLKKHYDELQQDWFLDIADDDAYQYTQYQKQRSIQQLLHYYELGRDGK